MPVPEAFTIDSSSGPYDPGRWGMQDGPGDGVRIYLVDDDRHLRVALETVLRRAGHEVRVAENGLEIRSLFQERPADLVICDQLMPGAEGCEWWRAVRRNARGKSGRRCGRERVGACVEY